MAKTPPVSRFVICDTKLGFRGKTVNDLGNLRFVVRGAVRIETSAMLGSGLIEHAEEVRHFLEGGILVRSGTDGLKTRTDGGTDGTVNFGQLLGLTDTLFARLMIRHLFISG